ncbi:unnamed protein product [Amoebophrya sp. A25]|nr:unnamed protein product [Amoebophrya sp. A25]|eukprot:GSA25T00016533001.1
MVVRGSGTRVVPPNISAAINSGAGKSEGKDAIALHFVKIVLRTLICFLLGFIFLSEWVIESIYSGTLSFWKAPPKGYFIAVRNAASSGGVAPDLRRPASGASSASRSSSSSKGSSAATESSTASSTSSSTGGGSGLFSSIRRNATTSSRGAAGASASPPSPLAADVEEQAAGLRHYEGTVTGVNIATSPSYSYEQYATLKLDNKAGYQLSQLLNYPYLPQPSQSASSWEVERLLDVHNYLDRYLEASFRVRERRENSTAKSNQTSKSNKTSSIFVEDEKWIKDWAYTFFTLDSPPSKGTNTTSSSGSTSTSSSFSNGSSSSAASSSKYGDSTDPRSRSIFSRRIRNTTGTSADLFDLEDEEEQDLCTGEEGDSAASSDEDLPWGDIAEDEPLTSEDEGDFDSLEEAGKEGASSRTKRQGTRRSQKPRSCRSFSSKRASSNKDTTKTGRGTHSALDKDLKELLSIAEQRLRSKASFKRFFSDSVDDDQQRSNDEGTKGGAVEVRDTNKGKPRSHAKDLDAWKEVLSALKDIEKLVTSSSTIKALLLEKGKKTSSRLDQILALQATERLSWTTREVIDSITSGSGKGTEATCPATTTSTTVTATSRAQDIEEVPSEERGEDDLIPPSASSTRSTTSNPEDLDLLEGSTTSSASSSPSPSSSPSTHSISGTFSSEHLSSPASADTSEDDSAGHENYGTGSDHDPNLDDLQLDDHYYEEYYQDVDDFIEDTDDSQGAGGTHQDDFNSQREKILEEHQSPATSLNDQDTDVLASEDLPVAELPQDQDATQASQTARVDEL